MTTFRPYIISAALSLCLCSAKAEGWTSSPSNDEQIVYWTNVYELGLSVSQKWHHINGSAWGDVITTEDTFPYLEPLTDIADALVTLSPSYVDVFEADSNGTFESWFAETNHWYTNAPPVFSVSNYMLHVTGTNCWDGGECSTPGTVTNWYNYPYQLFLNQLYTGANVLVWTWQEPDYNVIWTNNLSSWTNVDYTIDWADGCDYNYIEYHDDCVSNDPDTTNSSYTVSNLVCTFSPSWKVKTNAGSGTLLTNEDIFTTAYVKRQQFASEYSEETEYSCYVELYAPCAVETGTICATYPVVSLESSNEEKECKKGWYWDIVSDWVYTFDEELPWPHPSEPTSEWHEVAYAQKGREYQWGTYYSSNDVEIAFSADAYGFTYRAFDTPNSATNDWSADTNTHDIYPWWPTNVYEAGGIITQHSMQFCQTLSPSPFNYDHYEAGPHITNVTDVMISITTEHMTAYLDEPVPGADPITNFYVRKVQHTGGGSTSTKLISWDAEPPAINPDDWFDVGAYSNGYEWSSSRQLASNIWSGQITCFAAIPPPGYSAAWGTNHINHSVAQDGFCTQIVEHVEVGHYREDDIVVYKWTYDYRDDSVWN